jgi:hypothetical protein
MKNGLAETGEAVSWVRHLINAAIRLGGLCRRAL